MKLSSLLVPFQSFLQLIDSLYLSALFVSFFLNTDTHSGLWHMCLTDKIFLMYGVWLFFLIHGLNILMRKASNKCTFSLQHSAADRDINSKNHYTVYIH